MKELGFGATDIARKIHRATSTVSRELQRNAGRHGYDGSSAQRLSDQRRYTATKNHKRLPTLIEFVEKQLREEWSPELIAGNMKREGFPQVGHEWIYRHVQCDKIQGGTLYEHLCHKRGTNENTNGLTRQYFPKGTDFNTISEERIHLTMF